MLLVDSNVILDLVEDDPIWADWSQQQLEAASLRGPLIINAVIYAEVSIAFERIEELEAALRAGEFRLDPTPKEALFLAGRTFSRYRRQKGTKTGVLPDFFIGAHAAVLGIPLLTRDMGRFASYYPTVELITPKRAV
ncbi:MAG: type II toxin-antitoxin system VapC family toxin [Burkholderiales bacterium]